MRRVFTFAGFLAAFGLLVLSSGCGKHLTDDDDPSDDVRKIGSTRKVVAKTPLKAPLDGIISGRVIFEGDIPTAEPITAMNGHADKGHCLKGSESETTTQTWHVDGATKGVADAVIFIRPPRDKYFELTEAARTPATKIEEIRQPHCAFIPHVLTLFPKYFDGKEEKETGQKLKIINDAPIAHNVRYEGDPRKNGTFSSPVAPNGSLPLKVLTPENSPLNVSCQFHSWMSAKIWVFDNPFFAKTDAKGNFEIKNVPTGVPVTFIAWHEGKGEFVKETRTFTKGANPPITLKISK
ncbi:MAG: hypothetical protein FJ271_17230 [Planctomycetes bacterium]|nr:hypothetical protein [Planctomycetota bacterium]